LEACRKHAAMKPKAPPDPGPVSPRIDILRDRFYKELLERKQTSGKHARADEVRELRDKIYAEFIPAEGEAKYPSEQVVQAFSTLEERVIRDLILEGIRIDGRNPKQLRQITCEVGVLPRTHGSAIFTRGETQSLVTT